MAKLEYGVVKQSMRDLKVNLVKREFDRRSFLSTLSFPSLTGIKEPKSIENQIRKLYKNNRMVALECDSRVYKRMRKTRGFELHNLKDSQFFENVRGVYHVFDADYYSAFTEEVEQAFINMLRAGAIPDEGMLYFLTVKDEYRHRWRQRYKMLKRFATDGSYESGVLAYLKRIAKAEGYSIKRIACLRYANTDVVFNATPMIQYAIKITKKRKRG